MPFTVLVSDPLAEDAVQAMRDAGLDVIVDTDLSLDALRARIAGVEGIVVRSATKVRQDVIDAAAKLRLIVRAGVGLDNVDVEYARSKGIEVRNTPAASSNSVAELALAHLLAIARHVARGTVSMKSGKWEKKQLKGVEILGKTLGIIGIGRIGQCLAEKASALGMCVLAHDTFVSESPLPGAVTMVPFDRLLAESDFVSLHIPFDPSVGATIDAEALSKMKDGVRIVNCARGGVIDEAAIADALASGKVAGAALDVFADEPPDAGAPLFSQDNVSLTPHIGASTVEAQGRVGREAADIAIAFARGG